MKNKILIAVGISLVLIISIILLIVPNNSKTVSTITLDINPSIEINLTSNERVKKIVALNDDAKDIISDDLEGIVVDEALDKIIKNLVEKEYLNTYDSANIILYSEGELPKNVVQEKLNNALIENNVNSNIIVIEEISKEDEELAKKYNITGAKASYINSIVQENENIEIEDLVDKSTNELNETKTTGRYCDKGYVLEGDWCLKELEVVDATSSEVCPRGYYEHNGICYEETPFDETGKLECGSEFILENGKCIRKLVEESTVNYECSVGQLKRKGDYNPAGAADNEKLYCIDTSTGQVPKLKCLYNSGHIMINGKCYNGPAPLINGGCPDGGVVRNGGCYSLDDEDQWQCPDGKIYHKSQNSVPTYCPDTLKYYEPTIKGYSCRDGWVLEGTKCVLIETTDPRHERVCQDGYTLVDNDRCINSNKTTDKTNGFVCNMENSRLKDNTCIIYEIIEAKTN